MTSKPSFQGSDLTKTSRKLQLPAHQIRAAQKWLESSGRVLNDPEKQRMLTILVREYSTGKLDLDGLVNAVEEVIVDYPLLLPDLLDIFRDKPLPVTLTTTPFNAEEPTPTSETTVNDSKATSKDEDQSPESVKEIQDRNGKVKLSASGKRLGRPPKNSNGTEPAEKKKRGRPRKVDSGTTSSKGNGTAASEQQINNHQPLDVTDSSQSMARDIAQPSEASNFAKTETSGQITPAAVQEFTPPITPPDLNLEIIRAMSEAANADPEYSFLTPIEENHWENLVYIVRSVARHTDARDLFSEESHFCESNVPLQILEERCVQRQHYVTLNEFKDDMIRVLDLALARETIQETEDIPASLMNVRRHFEYLWSYYFPNYDGGRGRRRSPVSGKFPSPALKTISLPTDLSVQSSASTQDALLKVEPEAMYGSSKKRSATSPKTKISKKKKTAA